MRSFSEHEFKWFSAKKQAYDSLTYLVYQLEACFFGGETTWTYVLTRISEKTNFIKYILFLIMNSSWFPKKFFMLFSIKEGFVGI